MKNMTKEVRPTRSRGYLKHKLISATALLVVSAIMLVSSSYAWYVLSTAPEVSNIKTQVGANGALEIALLDADSWTDLSLLDMGDIDESLEPTAANATVSNLLWGNLINLDDSSYGMDQIILQPARLYIEPSNSGSGYTVNDALLKTPIYGEDGRVEGLDKTSAVAYTFASGGFSVEGDYGVRAIGTVADMGVFQMGMNAARSNLRTYASAAGYAASTTLNSTGGDLATIVVDYAVNKKTAGYTNADVAKIKALAEGLDGALDQIEVALRYAFAGYITTANAAAEGITAENYQTKLNEILAEGEGQKTLAQLLDLYPGIVSVIAGDAESTTAIDDISEYITKLTTNQTAMDNAIADCDNLTDGNHEWGELAGIIYPLVDTDKMTVAGMGVEELKNKVSSGSLDELVSELTAGGGLTVVVPSGSGILSDIADFAGDYSAEVTVAEFSYGSITLTNQKAVMTTDTDFNPTHLNDCSSKLQQADLAESSGSSAGITDYYGYAIDLAFRTNAEGSNLLLQTEPENRIYEGETQAALQGGGSYMSFTTSAGLSATKMVKLMSGIRVVLMDGNKNILGIAALDTRLGKDVYTVLDAATQSETGMYAYLDGSAGAYQNSDLIDQATYTALNDTSCVVFDKTTGKVTAKLYLYDYEMTKSTEMVNGVETVRVVNGVTQYTGGLTLKEMDDTGVITSLMADVPQKVTALVYLDGSVVNNSMVAANSMHSMTGVLNLQFSSSADLFPADNTQLKSDSSELTYTELSGNALYSSGYLYYNNTLCKVNEGYILYTGSDNKMYFSTGESSYTELTASSFATALTVVTATLTATPDSIAVGGTSALTASLSDTALTNVTYTFTMTEGATDTATTTSADNVLTVTGVAAGSVTYQAVLSVTIGSAAPVTITTNTATVTVTATE